MLVFWDKKSRHTDMNSGIRLTLKAKEQALTQDLNFTQILICSLSSVINFAYKERAFKGLGHKCVQALKSTISSNTDKFCYPCSSHFPQKLEEI